jgi:predicted exporter
MRTPKIQYPLLILTVVVTALLLAAAFMRLGIDTDVAAGLPEGDGALADAVYIFKHHPIQDEIAIDIAFEGQDRDMLVRAVDDIEARLRLSGLFKKVGMEDMQQVIPQLVEHVTDHLPLLFSARELAEGVAARISPQAVENQFKALEESLAGLNAIGQAGLIVRDPLAFRELKLSGLAELAPARNIQIYKGKLLSSDGRHAMVLAQPSGSGTDTAVARQLTQLLDQIDARMQASSLTVKGRLVMTPVGAYRAALDNETLARRDVNKAVLLATLGIAVLLMAAFPRPLIGLLALLPALAGTSLALFVYALFNKTISIMALGFGGAVISITVDHGIAYLLFLDRPEETSGRDASKEVWAVGLLAMLTTIGAFLVLSFCGFPIFKQLGIFTAMGMAFSFMFVHTVFPRIFPTMPPARSSRRLPLQRWADGLARLGLKGALAALLIAVCLVFWAKPNFNVDLSAMNSVSQSTRAAEALFAKVWGDVFSKIYLMTEARTPEMLQQKSDRLLSEIEAAQGDHEIQSAFSTASLFPGPARQQANAAAWHSFWSPQRVADLRGAVTRAAVQYGFKTQAFEPFFQRLTAPPQVTALPIDPRFHALFGISRSDQDGSWRQMTTVAAGYGYDGEKLYARFSNLTRMFDARYFSARMGRLLFSTFSRMLLIIGISVILLLFLFFADWQLTLISVLPMAFALVCTLGSLRLMGRSLDIPALMLAIIVLGMGIDYSLFFVRAYQRYQTGAHPNFSLIRMSVFMASVSTLIGFGALISSRHTLLQSAGISSFLGIGFSMAGAFLILPPILKRRFQGRTNMVSPQVNGAKPVLARYRRLEPYPRFFAKFKLKSDPMFQELPALVPPPETPLQTIIDIGTGYGVPACWLVQRYSGAKVYGIEPEPDRVRVANFALGASGTVTQGLAPQVPDAPRPADAACMLDMCHFLDDTAFQLTLERLHAKMRAGALLLIRMAVVPRRRMPWHWWLDNAKMRLQGASPHYRTVAQVTDLVQNNRFKVLKTQDSGRQNELVWIVASR